MAASGKFSADQLARRAAAMTDSHDAFNQYLDDRANGVRTIPGRLDSGLVQAVDRISALWESPVPSPDFVDRLEERMLNAEARSAEVVISPIAATPGETTRVTAIDAVRTATGVRRWLPILVSAALVLATLGIAWREFGPGRDDPSSHTGAPAINAPASPTPDATPDDTVLELTLPVDALPTTDRIRTVVDHLSIPPGTTTGGSSNCCSGPMIQYVISGGYAVTVAAPVQVIRAESMIDQIPANTEVALGPGDSLISRSEAPVQITVAGSEPAELLNWVLVNHSADRTKTEEYVRHEWLVYRDDTKNPLAALPRTPVTVRIRMVIVPNGNSIAAPESGMQFVMPVDDGSFVARLSDGSTQVFGEINQPVTTYILTTEQPGAATGTPLP
jgi:hypothetical protein